jgi:hypothetical protein
MRSPLPRSSTRRPRALLALVPLALTVAACGSGGGAVTLGDGGVELSRTTQAAAVRPTPHLVVTGPGPVAARLRRAGYSLAFRVTPNRAQTANHIVVGLSRDGVPVRGAHVRLAARMLTMDMGVARYALAGSRAGYAARTPAWLMAGRWELDLTVTPPGGRTISVAFDNRMR